MRIGLCGAHRTGKSTLAEAIAERLNIPFVTSPVSVIARHHNFNMDADRRTEPRFFKMQLEILDALCRSFQGDSFISDRTPLDAAAYLVADIQANSGDAEFQDDVLCYIDSCRRATEGLFDAVILLPPAIDFDPVDGKPGGNLAYQEHHHLVCRGLHADLGIPAGRILRDNIDLEDRVEAALDFIRDLTTWNGVSLLTVAA